MAWNNSSIFRNVSFLLTTSQKELINEKSITTFCIGALLLTPSILMASNRNIVIPYFSKQYLMAEWRGEWETGVMYKTNDAIHYAGSSYLCLESHVADLTTAPDWDTDKWSLVAAGGDQGEAGEKGSSGADGAVGAIGPSGVKGDTGDTGPSGAIGPSGVKGDTGDTGPAGTYNNPAPVNAVFGTGPINIYTGTGWVLEATSATGFQVRTTGSSLFLGIGVSHPTTCSSPYPVGEKFALGMGSGTTVEGTLCNEGSFGYAMVYDYNLTESYMFRCQRFAANAQVCQRYW